ncbi:Prevent-host-death family protein [Candidatus Accumulibacter aalborgensis]|uniref:Antitoxin n=1 Tax=Candidatus Accumulibacter aalborgensis TaxID=1860102 RepID=A0A1A8XUY9_9PROT|nr:type II toxin-antitoxin system prevent-host-death family antitoxin [Candidatus Accumulibacter aalborgensis]SBT07773.1 Prevent-host-death family protein [Candidatus Accumulibacter aalborgensis]
MQTIDIHAARTQFSQLVEQAAAGEEIIIVKAGKPVCRLIPLELEKKELRKLDIATGERLVPDDVDAMFAQKIEEIFYAERESSSSSGTGELHRP